MSTRTLAYSLDGAPVEVTIRAFTESEAIAYADKEQAARRMGEKLADFLDDGDEEVLAAVVSPPRAEMLELLEDAPGLAKQLAEEIWALSGNGLRLVERALTEAETATTAGQRRLLAIDVYERGADAPLASLVVRRIGRAALKVLQQHDDTKRRGRIPFTLTSKIAKESVVSGADVALWARLPPLSVALGVALLSKTVAAAQVAEGK